MDPEQNGIVTRPDTNGLACSVESIIKVLQDFEKSDTDFQVDLAQLATRTQGIKVSHQYVSKFKLGKVKSAKSKVAKALLNTLDDPSLVFIDSVQNIARLVDPVNKTRKKKTAIGDGPPAPFEAGESQSQRPSRAKIPKKVRLRHPAILFPIDKKNWISTLQLADKFRGAFVLKNPDFPDHHRATIWEQPKELDPNEDSFARFCKDENELLSLERPKKWKVLVNNKPFYWMLMVHGQSDFWNDLAQAIVKESARILLKHLKIPRKTSSGSSLAAKKIPATTPQKTPKNDAGVTFHPHQEQIGGKLKDLIDKKLQKTKSKLSDFEGFEFLLLLPDRVTLEKQSKDRLREVKQNLEESNFKDDDIENVIRINKRSSPMTTRWKDFLQSARSCPKILHVVVHDECHWAAGTGQASYEFLGFGNGTNCKSAICRAGECSYFSCKRAECCPDYHNLEDGQLLPNIFTLMVSATPYNFFAADWLKKDNNILNWVEEVGPGNYKGLKALKDEKKIISDDSAEKQNLHEDLRPLQVNGFSDEVILVLMDYMKALRDYKTVLSPVDESNTQLSVRRCIEEKKLIAIRLAKAKKNIRQSELAENALKATIERLGLDVWVWINAENDKSENGEKFAQFSDVDGLSMIMIIVERGRMGDTFPPNCIRFDLRARYLNIGRDFTAVIQDVGRAFGYGDRPALVLSKKANEFLKTVWDFDSDSLSWSNLRDEKIKILLGSQMKKKSPEDTGSPSKKPRLDDDDNEGDDEDEDDDEQDEDDQEDVENADEIKILQSIYRPDHNKPVFLYHLGESSFARRLILKAEPQIGKTGAFLNLIFRLSQSLRKPDIETWLPNFTKRVYHEENLVDIEEEFKTPEGLKDHKKYMSALQRAREARRLDGVFEPSKWAAQVLVGKVLESKKTPLSIADFGCGDMAFAKHLAEEITSHPEMLDQIEFKYHGYDISPNPIEDITTPYNLQVIKHPGVNCGRIQNFKANKFDFVISTCALWGMDPSWKNTLKAGFHSLKPDGSFLVAEFPHRLNSEVEAMLDEAGIRCATAKWATSRDTKQKFNANFHAREFSKTDDYSPDQF